MNKSLWHFRGETLGKKYIADRFSTNFRYTAIITRNNCANTQNSDIVSVLEASRQMNTIFLLRRWPRFFCFSLPPKSEVVSAVDIYLFISDSLTTSVGFPVSPVKDVAIALISLHPQKFFNEKDLYPIFLAFMYYILSLL